MFDLLWLIPTLPLVGFLVLALAGARLPRAAASLVGVGSVASSAAIALAIALRFFNAPPEGHAFVQPLWTFFDLPGLRVEAALRLDALSLVMVLVVTVVGALIHLYSTAYMRDDAGYTRFFAYMNLFVAAMLTLVLADDLFFLFLGWEGVGLCSYLLIGFWYDDPKNGRAAAKAFLVTRVGDAFMAVGMFLLVAQLGTLHIATVLERAPAEWAQGSGVATLAALLILGGALGKSGQLPLQVWLPDAMAGPTPVSALIHAATMVTAGVYLIARMNVLFTLAPAVQTAVAIIGAATLLVAGSCALVQRDIKRVLAYSTISQIGYMFLALGVGAWSAALFHFFTHAIFKALLFMAAGAIIVALHHEQDMFKMGGLRKRLPVVFWTFVIGAISLSAMPLIGAGFYSKDMILFETGTSELGGTGLWMAGFLGAFITSIYTFRMVFVTFFGDAKSHVHGPTPIAMSLPLIVLAVAATIAGLLELPRTLGHSPRFSHFIEHTLPEAPLRETSIRSEMLLQVASGGIVLLGLLLASSFWYRSSARLKGLSASPVAGFLSAGWGFDWLYDRTIVRPFVGFARANANDALDLIYTVLVKCFEVIARILRRMQNGRLRWYAAAAGAGAIVAIYLVVYA